MSKLFPVKLALKTISGSKDVIHDISKQLERQIRMGLALEHLLETRIYQD